MSRPDTAPRSPSTKRPTPAVRALYLSAAAVFFALGVAGAFLPVLPTTPFVLLTSWCLVRSSPRLHARLRSSPLFGPLLADWERHHGVRLHVKLSALGILICAVGASLWWGHLAPWLEITLVVLAAIGAIVILSLRTVTDSLPAMPERESALAVPQPREDDPPPSA